MPSPLVIKTLYTLGDETDMDIQMVVTLKRKLAIVGFNQTDRGVSAGAIIHCIHRDQKVG
ncbi:hypothetical protein DN37_3150 [Vibrio cholerae]|nr:hypothetical protein DN37_3150 [Vibrio cholerae]